MYRPLIAATLALAAISAPALAGSDTFKMDIAYSSEKLATLASAAAEYADIRTQVVERCKAEHAGKGVERLVAVRFCTERTLTSTVRAIGNANLTEVHQNRS